MTTATDVVNQVIAYMGGNQPPVTGSAPNFDNSPAGKAAAVLYAPCVQTVARKFGWDFARKTVTLVATGNTPPYPWAFEYAYPPNGVEVWQIIPGSLPDRNNPIPTNWVVANNIVSGQQARVIQTNVTGAIAVYNNAPNENTWDSLFRETVVRLLASEMAMAIAGKPDSSQGLFESSSAFADLAESRDG